VVTKYTTTP